jgi:hypothetical protein
MNPTIEIKQGINCHYIETRGVKVDDVPVGRYRLIDEARIEELWKTIKELPEYDVCKGTCVDLFNAIGMGKETK